MPDFGTLLSNLDKLSQYSGMLFQAGLGLLLSFDAVRARKSALRNSGYLLLLSLVSLILYAAMYLMFPIGLGEAMPGYLLYGGALLTPVLFIIYGTVGFASCEKLEIDDMPMLRSAFEDKRIPDRFFGRRYFLDVAWVAIAGPSLALLASGAFGVQLKTTLDSSDWVFLKVGADPSLPKIPLVAMSAVGAGIINRLGLQNWIAAKLKLRGSWYRIAIVVAAIVASGVPLSLDRVSICVFAIYFPLHVALGFLFKRYGLTTSVLAHGCFLAIYHSLA